jgi:hypothetical protein
VSDPQKDIDQRVVEVGEQRFLAPPPTPECSHPKFNYLFKPEVVVMCCTCGAPCERLD